MSSTLQAAYNEVALTNSRLRAEIERLRADNERLQALQQLALDLTNEQDAEIAQLQRRIDTLEGMLGEANIAVPE
jgi:ABC-type phosphate transport system auxiliary subunit